MQRNRACHTKEAPFNIYRDTCNKSKDELKVQEVQANLAQCISLFESEQHLTLSFARQKVNQSLDQPSHGREYHSEDQRRDIIDILLLPILNLILASFQLNSRFLGYLAMLKHLLFKDIILCPDSKYAL